MKQKLLLFLILCVELFAVFQWLDCRDFAGRFHSSAFDLELRLIEDIHNDREVPIWLVRTFHNKVVGTAWDTFGQYMEFWNVAFLSSFISLAGMVGLGAQFYNFFSQKKKQRLLWILLLFLLLAPFIEIFKLGNLPFEARLILIAIPFVLWSMLGYKYLLIDKKVNTKIIDVVLIISLWYQIALPTFMLFCTLK